MEKRIGRKDRASGEVASVCRPGDRIIPALGHQFRDIISYADHRFGIKSLYKTGKTLLTKKEFCSFYKSGIQFHIFPHNQNAALLRTNRHYQGKDSKKQTKSTKLAPIYFTTGAIFSNLRNKTRKNVSKNTRKYKIC